MRVSFLGGAEEIGASCALVEFANSRFLVDVGQRMGAPAGNLLPDFSLLEDDDPVDAILITHAHTDHIGALPALEANLPADRPIFATDATVALAKVMLQDSQRIVAQFRQGDGQIPHFPPPAVAGVIARFQGVPFGKPIPIAGAKATWFPAGHILGAAMLLIEADGESVLFSGDISVSDQRSVPGVFVPAVHPNVLVLESTYGDRMHAHRPTQEKRLVARVEECMRADGHVLFPTFALGRAQEVLVLLAEAMRRGDLPEVPVYGDGMVRSISRVYNRFPDYLSPACRRRWEEGLDPIFPEDLPIYRIRTQAERDDVAFGGRAIVVASSGMLQGGASEFYARQWIGQENNLILITGYQDEESPGQALLDLAAEPSAERRYFKLGGIKTEVACAIERFELSAHADNGELVAVASKLKADVILPVHGVGGSRQALARSLTAVCRAEVILPENGASYDFSSLDTRPRSKASRPDPMSAWPPWDPEQERPLDLAEFHCWLSAIEPRIPWITFEELGEIWKSPAPFEEKDRQELHAAVFEDVQRYFVPDARRPQLLHITAKENLPRPGESIRRQPLPFACEVLRSLFQPASGLVRFGFYPEEWVCQLEFRFPDSARRQYAERLREFEDRTGWTPTVTGHPSVEDFLQLLERALPGVSRDAVEVDHDCETVHVKRWPINGPGLDDDSRSDLVDRFRRQSGYQLHLPAPREEDHPVGGTADC